MALKKSSPDLKEKQHVRNISIIKDKVVPCFRPSEVEVPPWFGWARTVHPASCCSVSNCITFSYIVIKL